MILTADARGGSPSGRPLSAWRREPILANGGQASPPARRRGDRRSGIAGRNARSGGGARRAVRASCPGAGDARDRPVAIPARLWRPSPHLVFVRENASGEPAPESLRRG